MIDTVIGPLSLQGTPFQLAVWQECARIPFGETITYSELARRIGRPKACRAVAMALHCNPLPLIIPCHRVVASHGLGGYAFGVEVKRMLLEMETF